MTSVELPLAHAGTGGPRRFRDRRLPGWFSWRVLSGSLLSGFIMGTVLVSATAVVVVNLLVDLLYVALDPRVRLGRR